MIYEYYCDFCDVKFDSFTHDYNMTETECPYCGNKSFRIPSKASLNFKSWQKRLKQEQDFARGHD